MNLKRLLPIIIILAVLVVLVAVKKAREKPVSIVEQAQLTRLVPEDLSKAKIARVELYAGAKPEEKVVLKWDDAGKRWRAATKYDAPVKESKIDEFLDSVLKLRGEFRATADTETKKSEYQLTEEDAFHVAGFAKGGEEPLFHVLVGKASDYQTVFMRKAGSDEVFTEATNLRSDAGIYGDDRAKAPEARVWLDLDVVDLETDDIRKIELTMPDKHLLFAKEAKPKEDTPEEDATVSEETDDIQPPAEDDEAEEAAPVEEEAEEEIEYEWTLAEGGPAGVAFDETKLNNLLRRLDKYTARDVADPTKKTEYKLDPPEYECIISVEGLEEDIVIHAARSDADDGGYLYLPNVSEDIVYEVRKWAFEQLFPKGSDLFTLPKMTITKVDIGRIEIDGPERRVVAVKDNDAWVVVEPEADLDVQETTLDTAASALAALRAIDYADTVEDTGLEAPAQKILVAAGAEQHTIVLGGPSKHVDGTYARFDDNPLVLAISETDVGKIAMAPKDLYQRKVLDIDEDDIAAVDVASGEKSFRLAREDGPWALTVGQETPRVDEDAVDEFLRDLVQLQADDILFGETKLAGEPFATIRVDAGDEGETLLTFGAGSEGAHPLRVAGKQPLLQVKAEDVAALLDAEALRQPEPEPESEPPVAEEGTAGDEVVLPAETGEGVPAEETATVESVESTATDAGPNE